MAKNNKKVTWKAIIAVILVMASLFAMSSIINAGIVEFILGEEYSEIEAVTSSSETGHVHNFFGNGIDSGKQMCVHGYQKIFYCFCGETRVGCTTCNPHLLD